jgi:hypothetical protein
VGAWVATRERDYPTALGRIAEALALDKTGEYRERLLQKQQEVLARLTQRHQQEYLLLINLVSKYAAEEKNINHRGTETQRIEHREDGIEE